LAAGGNSGAAGTGLTTNDADAGADASGGAAGAGGSGAIGAAGSRGSVTTGGSNQGGNGASAGTGNTAGGGAGGGKCVVTGADICDGVDNDCSGKIDDSSCSSGCVGRSWNGRGYMFCIAEKTFETATAECTKQSLRLARVESAEENAWLLKMIQDMSVDVEVTFILDGTDKAQEGRWEWGNGSRFWNGAADGAPVDGHFANWDDPQPNDSDNFPGEDCVTFQARNGMWNDQSCTAVEYSVICERD
jgi:hypothetical protein